MPWRSRTRMPTRRPAKAAMVVNRQEPSIQASGIFSQLKMKPPTLPIAIASTTGAMPSWPMMCLRSGLKGNSFWLKALAVALRMVGTTGRLMARTVP